MKRSEIQVSGASSNSVLTHPAGIGQVETDNFFLNTSASEGATQVISLSCSPDYWICCAAVGGAALTAGTAGVGVGYLAAGAGFTKATLTVTAGLESASVAGGAAGSTGAVGATGEYVAAGWAME